MNENNKLPTGWGDTEDEDDFGFPEEEEHSPWGAASSSNESPETDETENQDHAIASDKAEIPVLQQNLSGRKKSNTPLIIGIAAAVIVAGAGGVFGGILLTKDHAKPEKQETISASEATELLETTEPTTTEKIAAAETTADTIETTETSTTETEPVPFTFAEKFVNAVLEHESLWKSSLGDGSNECWFQDLDMDGVPEFIAGGYQFSDGHVQYAAFHPYYFENGSLQPMSNGNGEALQLLFDAGQSSGGQDGFICQLFKDRQSGSFSYMYQSVYPEGRAVNYYLKKMFCDYPHALPVDTILDLEYDGEYWYVPEYSYELGVYSTMTREQFLAAYDDIFTQHQFCRTNTKAVSCDAISFDALIESYDTWGYEQGTASDLPLANVISDVRSLTDTMIESTENNVSDTTAAMYSAYADIAADYESEISLSGLFLVDLNGDGRDEMILPDADSYEFRLYEYADGTVYSRSFGGWQALGNFVLYTVSGEDGTKYVYYRDNYSYMSMQGYYHPSTESSLYIFIDYPSEGENYYADWRINYENSFQRYEISAGYEPVDTFYAQPPQCHDALLSAFSNCGFAIREESNYTKMIPVSLDLLYEKADRSY